MSGIREKQAVGPQASDRWPICADFDRRL